VREELGGECDDWCYINVMTPRVFVSYAREDRDVAKRLSLDLSRIGATPWLDIHNLRGGQHWELALRTALKQSTHVALLISQHSTTKRGYVQREQRLALDLLDEFPPDAIFILPIRLDAAVPTFEKLHQLHWIDLFPDYPDAIRRIGVSLGLTPNAAVVGALPRFEAAFADALAGEEMSPDQAAQALLDLRLHFDVPLAAAEEYAREVLALQDRTRGDPDATIHIATDEQLMLTLATFSQALSSMARHVTARVPNAFGVKAALLRAAVAVFELASIRIASRSNAVLLNDLHSMEQYRCAKYSLSVLAAQISWPR